MKKQTSPTANQVAQAAAKRHAQHAQVEPVPKITPKMKQKVTVTGSVEPAVSDTALLNTVMVLEAPRAEVILLNSDETPPTPALSATSLATAVLTPVEVLVPEAETPLEVATTSERTKVKKMSALDAAAQVLAESDRPLNAQEMIEAMARKGYWTSPGGKTPHATLYAAILRKINVKGTQARFQKTARGHFARQQTA